MDETARPGVLKRLDMPVLIVATRSDGLVSWRAIRKVAARLPKVRLVVYGGEARHEILRESDEVRMAALAEIDAFLDPFAPAA
jgi:lysophospholipase